jgi:hypothetical protein
VESKTQLIKRWSIFLIRQHVSALVLGHHQASNCVLKETIQCRYLPSVIYIGRNFQRDLIAACCIVCCIVSFKTQFETWWWPNARAETCCLINKILHLFISCVFDSTTYTILLRILSYPNGLRKCLAFFKVVFSILQKIRYQNLYSKFCFAGFEILSLTVKYEYELQECKNKILLRTHKDCVRKTCI